MCWAPANRINSHPTTYIITTHYSKIESYAFILRLMAAIKAHDRGRNGRPPNFTGSSPAYGSPVSSFHIGIGKLIHELLWVRTARVQQSRRLCFTHLLSYLPSLAWVMLSHASSLFLVLGSGGASSFSLPSFLGLLTLSSFKTYGTMKALTPAGVLSHPPVSLFISHKLPTIPSPTTWCAHISFFFIAMTTYVMSFRLRSTHACSPQHPAESSSFPTDWSFISSCSPPHLAVTQLLLITELWHSPTRTFTVLFMRLHRRTCGS